MVDRSASQWIAVDRSASQWIAVDRSGSQWIAVDLIGSDCGQDMVDWLPFIVLNKQTVFNNRI